MAPRVVVRRAWDSGSASRWPLTSRSGAAFQPRLAKRHRHSQSFVCLTRDRVAWRCEKPLQVQHSHPDTHKASHKLELRCARLLQVSMLALCESYRPCPLQQPFVSAIESVAAPTAQTAKAWLQASPSGAYTTARTHSGKVFEWSAHVQRTADSIRQMAPVGDAVDLVDPAKLRRRLDGAAGAVVDAYRATHGGEELKLTFLVSWDDDGEATVAAHASPLPPIPSKPVRVERAARRARTPRQGLGVVSRARFSSEIAGPRADERTAPLGRGEDIGGVADELLCYY